MVYWISSCTTLDIAYLSIKELHCASFAHIRREHTMVGRTKDEWSFGYDDLERITGLPRDTCIQHRVRGQFDPEKLETVVYYLLRHAKQDIREELVLSLVRRVSEASIGKVLPGKKNIGKKKKKA